MSRGTQISDEQIETIKATFAQCGSYRKTAREVGVGVATVKKYADTQDEYEQIRTVKRLDHIERLAQVQAQLLEELTSVAKLRDATLKDVATTYGIVTDKLLLMRGQATSRTETISPDPAARLTPEEMEQAARIREKHAALVPV